jgi:hypothetical protein
MLEQERDGTGQLLFFERPSVKKGKGRKKAARSHAQRAELIRCKPSTWIEQNISIDGGAPNLRYRPWWELPINLPYVKFSNMAKDVFVAGKKTEPEVVTRRQSVWTAGRQVEKSSTLASSELAEAQISHTKILYVSPSSTQLGEFSFRRLDQTVKSSDLLTSQVDHDHWNVGLKAFLNQSTITLRSSFLSPDRVRGIPAEILDIDEVQDILTENIPVIRETLAHCSRIDGPIYRLSGTPKTFDNPLEFYWSQESTQNEWMVRCDKCGKWSEGLVEDNIGKKGLVCRYCKAPLNPFGTVVDDRRVGAGWFRTGPAMAPFEGFRIPQLLLPYCFSYNAQLFKRKWDEIFYKFERYARYRLFNEVLGISYDSGDKPITRKDLQDVCMPSVRLVNLDTAGSRAPNELTNGYVFCGVDWGTGDPSRTVFTAGRYTADQVYEVFYIKIFDKRFSEPEAIIKEVLRLLKACNGTYVGVDWGLGFGLNSQIRTGFGAGKTFVYCHTDQREKLVYSPNSSVYTTNRTAVISDIFQLVKQKKLRFRCSWEELLNMGAAQDFLNVHKDVNRLGCLKYDHAPGTTDDTLHSLIYGFLASYAKFPRVDLN